MERIVAVTTSLPERADLLEEAVASVNRQTIPVHHVISVHDRTLSELDHRNLALAQADEMGAEWYAFCDDDDLWTSTHVETAVWFMHSADVIVSDFTVRGKRDWRDPENRYPSWSVLEQHNWFNPSAVIVRATALGRWDPPSVPPPDDWLDHATWRRLYREGARFACTRRVTAIIRYGDWPNENDAYGAPA